MTITMATTLMRVVSTAQDGGSLPKDRTAARREVGVAWWVWSAGWEVGVVNRMIGGCGMVGVAKRGGIGGWSYLRLTQLLDDPAESVSHYHHIASHAYGGRGRREVRGEERGRR